MKFEERLIRNVCRDPFKTAVVFREERISYLEFFRDTVNISNLLLRSFGSEQKRILILSHNSIPEMELICACFLSGNTACPVNWRLSAAELSRYVEAGDFQEAFYDDQDAEVFREVSSLLRTKTLKGICIQEIRMSEDFREASLDELIQSVPGDLSDVRMAIQFFTSGSTGKPKGILHSMRSMMEYAEAYILASEWTSDTIYQTLANLFHLSGFSCIISIIAGGTLVLMDRFQKDLFFETMARENCTRVSMVPTLLSLSMCQGLFEKYDFSRVKKIVYGGSPMPANQAKTIMEQYGIHLEGAYGSTEACNITILSSEDHEKCISGEMSPERLKSAGKPVDQVIVRIRREDGTAAKTGETGEICIQSPFLFSAYSTIERPVLSGDGFYHTRDVGFMDQDGYVYIVDRKDDLLISGGENIYPREIENCIMEMNEDVDAVSVVGLKDPIWGEAVAAAVIRKPGSSLTEEDVIDFCRKHIAGYKKPKKVFFLKQLPLNANGKIDRKELSEELSRLSQKRENS